MQQFDYIVTQESGVHARPAGMLVNVAKKYSSVVKVMTAEKSAEITTMISVMGLGLKQGDKLTVTVDGADEAEAITALKEFFEKFI